VGIEDVGGLQDGVFAEVEDNAQVVQQSDQLGLVGFFKDVFFGADGGVFADADDVFVEVFQALLDLEPA
jgi:hypothetical protein